MDKETDMVQCFFNPSHMIFRSRYPYHYQKCRKEHRNVKHKVCPYNALHIMEPQVYDDHIRKCDSRPLSALVGPDTFACQPVIEDPTNTWEESAWDVEQEPVVPQNVQGDIFIYTPLIGGSKSERKQHRLAERRQYLEIENRLASQAESNEDKKKKKKKKKSRNSKSNLENFNNAPGNNPIPNKVGNKPLTEQIYTTPDSLNFGGLSLKD